MTSRTADLEARTGRRTVRLVACAVAVAAAVPYLVLKVVWLTGGDLGLRTLEPSPELDALNAVTAGMDVVAVLLAGVFAFRWGRRVPAPLVLVPMWVGTGLLGVVAVGLPVVTAAAAVTGTAVLPDSPDLPVAPWVYRVVYTGFAVQAVGLLTAFFLYARERWPAAFDGRVGRRRPEPAPPHLRAVLDPVTVGSTVAAIAIAGVHLSWGLGSTAGLAAGAGDAGVVAQAVELVHAGVVLAAVVGLLMLVRGWGAGRPTWVATVLAWGGSGAMFGWGLWTTVMVLLAGAGVGGGVEPDLTGLLGLLRFAVGIVMGLALLLALAERRAGAARDAAFAAVPAPRGG